MPKQSPYKKTRQLRRNFFRQWREQVGLTQDQLADRIGTTKTRVSMKENGQEPYDQYYLEALSDALGVDKASLLMRDPDDGEGIWSIWDRASIGDRQLIERIARSAVSPTGSQTEEKADANERPHRRRSR